MEPNPFPSSLVIVNFLFTWTVNMLFMAANLTQYLFSQFFYRPEYRLVFAVERPVVDDKAARRRKDNGLNQYWVDVLNPLRQKLCYGKHDPVANAEKDN